ncbi:MAG: hypothetical protein M0R32_03160 [Candidatus Cloacimonetes bacterium]|jgi:hypothetical protein|nr:hypothetical protein [Candidatus Cloacimonadota bacterium]
MMSKKSWNKLVRRVKRKSLYQEYPHPDLLGFPSQRSYKYRYRAVAETLKNNGFCHIVEIGSNVGSGCLEMSKQGLGVTGIEADKDYFDMACFLSKSVKNSRALNFINADCSKFNSYILYEAIVGLNIWEEMSTSFSVLIDVLAKTSICSCQIIELPIDGFNRWPESLKEELSLKDIEVERFILNEFRKFGYVKQKLIYTDDSFQGRKTFCLLK